MLQKDVKDLNFDKMCVLPGDGADTEVALIHCCWRHWASLSVSTALILCTVHPRLVNNAASDKTSIRQVI